MWLILLLPACGNLLTIDIEESSTTTIEQGTLLEELIGDLGFGGFAQMDVTDNQTLANQGVEPGDLESVKLISMELEAVEGDGDLSFIDTLSFSATAPDVDTVVIGDQSDFPEGQAVVEMNLYDVDLVDHAVSESMTITTDVTAGRPTSDTKVKATFTMRIKATVQGARNQIDND
jgi:hypothetical protein